MIVLDGEHLSKRYRTPGRTPLSRGSDVVAVDDACIRVHQQRSVGIIGESGAGKSTLAGILLRLVHPDSGVVRFRGQDVWTMDRDAVHDFRRNVQAVFQDPYSSFDPRWSIGRSVQEPLAIHGIGNRAERDRLLCQALDAVRLPSATARRRPAELSGGQLQRAGIARALICEPTLIVCDEPLSALDVSIQAQIACLMIDIQAERGVSYVLISHDIAMTSVLTHDILVMKRGVVVETGPVDEVLANPRHEYTATLIESVRHVTI